ncbi:Telomere recombination [Aspergillus sclerotialis]|uniref:Threonylcarbamoyl-AMP synthase n=1 Tax=Aspergillus sclerotialis TaxID=2070753 RepID=A0A3A2ZZX5_9EURO|nr:Telomere recombination [Aspergillus sclerotialis]
MSDPEKIIDIPGDAYRVFEVLKGGGVAIIPASVGYGLVAIEPEALQRVFAAKQRKPHKKHAMIGSYFLHRQIHVLPPREEGMVKLLTVDMDLPMGVVAPFREDHHIIQKLGKEMLDKSSVGGTLAMLVNGGQFQEELSRLATEAGLPLMGSSANLSGKGTKTVVEDIEQEVRDAADIIIDYGRQKFSYPRPSSTMFDFKHMRLLRFGACYNVIQDAFQRFYGITLPDDPGQEALFSGHLGQEANVY